MIKTNTYRVEVSPDTDFLEGWTDSRVPNMVFMYDQESLEECEEVDGIYYATYQTWEVVEPRTMTYSKPDGQLVNLQIAVGEYGKL
jgi:hypothetical protein